MSAGDRSQSSPGVQGVTPSPVVVPKGLSLGGSMLRSTPEIRPLSRVPRYEARTASFQGSSRSNVALYCWMRGCLMSNGTALADGCEPNTVNAPPVKGLMPCGFSPPGQPESGVAAGLVLVRPWLKALVAIGSRIPCAADVG